jgi:hypothetical protein
VDLRRLRLKSRGLESSSYFVDLSKNKQLFSILFIEGTFVVTKHVMNSYICNLLKSRGFKSSSYFVDFSKNLQLISILFIVGAFMFTKHLIVYVIL